MSTPAIHRRPPGARLLPARLFYGWYIAAAAVLVNFVGVGIGYYGLAVFLRPLQEEHGWSTGAVSGATGLYFVTAGLTSALIGPYIDRLGAPRFLLLGMAGMGVGTALIGHVETLWQLYLVYLLMAGAFGVGVGVGIQATIARWFVHKRARAISIGATGISFGGIVFAPLGSALIAAGGLELATPVLGAILVVVSLPVIWLFVAWDPSEMGLEPDGGAPPARTARRAQLSLAAQRRVWTVRLAGRTLTFWAILVAFVLGFMAQTGVFIHQVAFLEDRFGSRDEAALALSVTAAGTILARVFVGVFADAWDKRRITVALFALQGMAVLLLLHVESTAASYLAVLAFGFTVANLYMLQTLLVGEFFGFVSFGTVFGFINMASSVSSGVGPALVGWLEDATGSYTLPFTLMAALALAAAAAIAFARPLGSQGSAGASHGAGKNAPALTPEAASDPPRPPIPAGAADRRGRP